MNNNETNITEQLSYKEQLEFKKYLEEKNKSLADKIWDFIVNVLSTIVGVIAAILYMIMNIGGCIIYGVFMALAFWLGWAFLVGIFNWIF